MHLPSVWQWWLKWTVLTALAGAWAFHANAAVTTALRPESVHTADTKKTQVYLKDGLFVGGDRSIDHVVIKGLRRAPNAGYERIVLDLEGTLQGEPAAVSRAPYYQIAVNNDEKRLIFTVWGKPTVTFDTRKVAAQFAKSRVVKSVELLPKVEDDTWTFVVSLKDERPIEVFELSEPSRIIVDIRDKR